MKTLIIATLIILGVTTMAQPAEVLITAQDIPASGFLKGYPVVVKESPAVWGSKEGLPNFIIMTITDTPASVVEHFLNDWKIKYLHSIVAENELGYRLMVEVDPAYISASDVGKDQIKTEMQDWVESIDGVVHAFTQSSMTFDVPKPLMLYGDPATLADLRAAFDDVFDDVLDIRRYYFLPVDVDWAVDQGGFIEVTQAQALAKLQDKLAE